MKKIILIRSTYSPYGGVERVALGLAKGLLGKGAQVVLLTLPRQKWPLAHPDFVVVPLGVNHAHRLLQAWFFNRAVNTYLAAHKADVIFSLDKVTCFTHLHAGGGAHKTFLRIKNAYSNVFSRFFRRFSPFHQYILHLEKKGFDNPLLQKIRCNSSMVKDDIQKEYGVCPDKLIVIHSGIRWREMADTYTQKEQVGETLCRRHGLDPQWPMLLFLGSGFDRKGLAIAIQGLAVMSPEYHLVVVGKGAIKPYAKLAEKYGCRRRVHFCGPQPRGWRYASFCKALVLPSYYDPFGGASAEGHAMGIPVLVSDKTGYCDQVIPGENGVILATPMTDARIQRAFAELAGLIENPVRTPDQLRWHARAVDDDVILETLLSDFIPTPNHK